MVSRRKRKVEGRQASPEPAVVDEALYRAFLTYVFDRPITPNGWYFDLDEPDFEATPVEAIALFERVMRNAGADLAPFSDAQVAHGVNYIFSGSCSDFVHAFSNGAVPLEDRITAIRSIKHLYKDCFERRAAPVLGHLSEASDNPLCYIVYMLWDETGIPAFGTSISAWMEAVIDVLSYALDSSNDACIESALHGLGHYKSNAPALVEKAIDRFLETTCDADSSPVESRAPALLRPLRSELRDYARAARTGCIQ